MTRNDQVLVHPLVQKESGFSFRFGFVKYLRFLVMNASYSL